MKKIMALMLALVLVFALCACGGDKTPANNASTATDVSKAPESEAPAANGGDAAFTTARADSVTRVFCGCAGVTRALCRSRT